MISLNTKDSTTICTRYIDRQNLHGLIISIYVYGSIVSCIYVRRIHYAEKNIAMLQWEYVNKFLENSVPLLR